MGQVLGQSHCELLHHNGVHREKIYPLLKINQNQANIDCKSLLKKKRGKKPTNKRDQLPDSIHSMNVLIGMGKGLES